MLAQEIVLLQRVSFSPNVVTLLGIFENDDQIILLFDYYEFGSIQSFMQARKKKLPEEDCKSICIQLLLAADLFHRKSILHRDLKPDNILLRQDHRQAYDVVIADLGLSIEEHNILKSHCCGTPGYVAPEILTQHHQSYKADIFSIGCIVFKLLTGRSFFLARNFDEMMKVNSTWDSDNFELKLDNVSSHCLSLMQSLLSNFPKRPFARDAL
jgi:calcium/calmodulin-dependent protein kinase I